MSSPISRRTFVGGTGGALAGLAVGSGAQAAESAGLQIASAGANGEIDIERAKTWWPNPRNAWAPMGWPDHLFRFNVFYNGSIIGAPCPLGRVTDGVRQYAGKGIQLDMNPWGGWFTSGPPAPLHPGHFYVYREDYGLYGHGTQRWANHPTPVLETDWPQSNGTVLRQSVFAHKFRGGAVGGNPEREDMLVAWVRLSVAYVNPLGTSGPIGFAIRLARPYYTQEYPYTYQDGVVLTGYPELAELEYTRWTTPMTGGMKIWQPAGPRVAVLTGHSLPVLTKYPNNLLYSLQVTLPAQVGAHTDLMVAMMPAYEPYFDEEAALGYDGALAAANAYWSGTVPATAATIDTPEIYINQAIRRNIQISQVVAEKVPETGQLTFLTGSYGYDVLWSTPTSMTSHMFLDLLGYHGLVASHVELYRTTQGTKKAPGAAYPMHNGYYATPANLIAIDWLTDHGAIMLAIATHALVTGDQAFITVWLDSLVKACDFIKMACGLTNHNGVRGLPPPAVATDEGLETQTVWNMAWLYKGLTTTIRVLEGANHPRAAEFATVAANFRSTFVSAFDAYGARQPTWLHPDGNRYPVYSQNLIDTPPGAFGEAMRLDIGPMVLVWAGLMDANDVRMVKFADYFRYGPNANLWGDGNRKNALDRPVLLHEMSSCEPGYSWNVFHSWMKGDRDRFLEGMYSMFAGAMSPQTYVPFEHRDGMSAVLSTNTVAYWLARHAVVDDSLNLTELHLLRLCPLAWLSPDRDTLFQRMPTTFGPVNLRFRTTGTELNLTWSGTWRRNPARIVVHAPPGITALVVNGTRYAVPSDRQVVVPRA